MVKKLLFISITCLFLTCCNLFTGERSLIVSNVDERYSGLKNLSYANKNTDTYFSDYMATLEGLYEILVITDIHVDAYFYRKERTEAFYRWLDNYDKSKIAFCLSLGDFADSGAEREIIKYTEIVDKIQAHKGLLDQDIKVFNVVGNHDLYMQEGWEAWKKYCYPNTSYYRFETKNIVWYGLDTGAGSLGQKQLNDFTMHIKNEKKMPVVFTHYPIMNENFDVNGILFSLRDSTERNILLKTLRDCNTNEYICGHYHSGGSKYFGFNQNNLKSFGQYGKWYIMTVDENKKSISFKEFSDK